MESLLRLPRVRDDRRRLACLSPFQIDARLGTVPIAPGRLDKDVTAMRVPGPGDGAESRPITARVLARDEAEVAGELRRALEAAPVNNLRREHHGRVERDAAKALQTRDHRRERRQEGELFDLTIQFIASLELVHQQGMVLSKHEPVVRGERRSVSRQVLQPLEVGRAPVGAVAKHESRGERGI
jgi:hypothetical protein